MNERMKRIKRQIERKAFDRRVRRSLKRAEKDPQPVLSAVKTDPRGHFDDIREYQKAVPVDATEHPEFYDSDRVIVKQDSDEFRGMSAAANRRNLTLVADQFEAVTGERPAIERTVTEKL